MLIIVYLVILFCSLQTNNATNILGIFPLTAKSHFAWNHAILESLHEAGHQITMIAPFPPLESTQNFTYIDSRFNDMTSDEDKYSLGEAELPLSYTLHKKNVIHMKLCNDVMKLSPIQEALNSPEKLYDVIFIESWSGYECYLSIAEKLDIPVIGTVAVNTWRWADQDIGLSHNPAVIQVELGFSNIEMNFVQRVQNLWNCLLVDYFIHEIRKWVTEEFNRSYFNGISPHKKRVSLMFYNNHASLLPRQGVPNAIEIAGIHVKPANPLPKDLHTFIEEAEHGVILFSLGSIAKSNSMTVEQKQAFITAFELIPQRVIWKFEESIKNLPKNVMISKWLPQRDILEHKNVIAFISHCGLGGMYEAVITGTPVVTIPLMFDQRINAGILHYRGVGVGLSLESLTRDTVLNALNAIINDTSYYHQMQKLSHTFKDRPMTSQQTVLYWTEYVIRHNGAPHLKAIGTEMPFYKYFMLDIIALFLVLTSMAVLMIYIIVQKLYIYFLGFKKAEHAFQRKKGE